MDNRFVNPDNDHRGDWASGDLVANEERKDGYYDVTGPTGRVFNVPKGKHWVYSQENMLKFISEGRIWFGKNGDAFPRLKRYLSEVQQGRKCDTLWLSSDVGHNQEATREIKSLFDGFVWFDTPKPIRLLKRCVELTMDAEDLCLDFFAGSSTTAHAIFEKNHEDNGKRRFIMVQMPESTGTKEYPTIADVSRERIRRAIVKIKPENKGMMNLNPNEDLGFKSFKLVQSHFTEWQAYTERDTNQLELRFTQAESPLVAGWQAGNLLVEILLLQGFPLDSQIHPLSQFQSNQVLEVTSEFCQHRLYVCLDAKIQPETVQALKLRSEDILVTLDSALSDEAKITLADQVNLKVI